MIFQLLKITKEIPRTIILIDQQIHLLRPAIRASSRLHGEMAWNSFGWTREIDEKEVLPRSDSERINEEHAPKSIYRRIRGVIERGVQAQTPDIEAI